MNPLYNTNDSPNAATQPTKAVNNQTTAIKRSHNTFDMSYHVFTTQHYGTLEPFFVMEGVAGDRIPLSSQHDVRTFPMSSPFLSKLTLNKDYFCVPMQAILPNTWEYIFKNPSQGDDVDIQVYPVTPIQLLGPMFLTKAISFSNLLSAVAYDTINDPMRIAFLSALFSAENLMSSGSLLFKLGYNMQFAIFNKELNKTQNLDEFFDYALSDLGDVEFQLVLDGVTYNYTTKETSVKGTLNFNITKNQALVLLRQYLPFAKNIKFKSAHNLNSIFDSSLVGDGSMSFVNLSRVFAYQIACYQFYVNPQVDFIYNAQLYRDNFFTLYNQFIYAINGIDATIDTFEYNGAKVPYDYLSNHYLSTLYNIGDQSNQQYQNTAIYSYQIVNYLFGYNYSLKFGDYFTDSRTRPYAPGDMNAPVTANNVSAIDVTKSIVMQRFLNNVVRLGNNFGDYLRGIFGTNPSPDYHFPKFISHQSFDISGFEVANTTETSQGNLVTNLKSSDDKYAFEVELDMPCILIGISYFTMPQVYCQATDKHFFHADRFDFFNPMLQYIGDQPVDVKELSIFYPSVESAFGYQSRYAEYKQRFSIANGGFVNKLPAWAFVSDKPTGELRNILPAVKQSPYFIRSLPSDFDRFLSGLSGLSLADNFHFIVVYNNKVVANRPIEVNPNIL